MAKKVKLTRPELKRYRDALGRFERYLPMLKLKQQQLQMAVRDVLRDQREADAAIINARQRFEPYRAILNDIAGVNVTALAQPEEVKTSERNIAGVNIPVFEGVSFAQVNYSLFATPAWVDRAMQDLRELNRCQVKFDIVSRQYELLQHELTKISQRVNLFEKVKIHESKEAIRVIRIKLGDEMTAAVGRSKIAKSKIAEGSDQDIRESHAHDTEVSNI